MLYIADDLEVRNDAIDTVEDIMKVTGALLSQDDFYGERVEVLDIEIADNGTLSGRFRNASNNRVFQFKINGEDVSYRPYLRNRRKDSTEHEAMLQWVKVPMPVERTDAKFSKKCRDKSYRCGNTCISILHECHVKAGEGDRKNRKSKTAGLSAKRVENLQKRAAEVKKSAPELSKVMSQKAKDIARRRAEKFPGSRKAAARSPVPDIAKTQAKNTRDRNKKMREMTTGPSKQREEFAKKVAKTEAEIKDKDAARAILKKRTAKESDVVKGLQDKRKNAKTPEEKRAILKEITAQKKREQEANIEAGKKAVEKRKTEKVMQEVGESDRTSKAPKSADKTSQQKANIEAGKKTVEERKKRQESQVSAKEEQRMVSELKEESDNVAQQYQGLKQTYEATLAQLKQQPGNEANIAMLENAMADINKKYQENQTKLNEINSALGKRTKDFSRPLSLDTPETATKTSQQKANIEAGKKAVEERKKGSDRSSEKLSPTAQKGKELVEQRKGGKESDRPAEKLSPTAEAGKKAVEERKAQKAENTAQSKNPDRLAAIDKEIARLDRNIAHREKVLKNKPNSYGASVGMVEDQLLRRGLVKEREELMKSSAGESTNSDRPTENLSPKAEAGKKAVEERKKEKDKEKLTKRSKAQQEDDEYKARQPLNKISPEKAEFYRDQARGEIRLYRRREVTSFDADRIESRATELLLKDQERDAKQLLDKIPSKEMDDLWERSKSEIKKLHGRELTLSDNREIQIKAAEILREDRERKAEKTLKNLPEEEAKSLRERSRIELDYLRKQGAISDFTDKDVTLKAAGHYEEEQQKIREEKAKDEQEKQKRIKVQKNLESAKGTIPSKRLELVKDRLEQQNNETKKSQKVNEKIIESRERHNADIKSKLTKEQQKYGDEILREAYSQIQKGIKTQKVENYLHLNSGGEMVSAKAFVPKGQKDGQFIVTQEATPDRDRYNQKTKIYDSRGKSYSLTHKESGISFASGGKEGVAAIAYLLNRNTNISFDDLEKFQKGDVEGLQANDRIKELDEAIRTSYGASDIATFEDMPTVMQEALKSVDVKPEGKWGGSMTEDEKAKYAKEIVDKVAGEKTTFNSLEYPSDKTYWNQFEDSKAETETQIIPAQDAVIERDLFGGEKVVKPARPETRQEVIKLPEMKENKDYSRGSEIFSKTAEKSKSEKMLKDKGITSSQQQFIAQQILQEMKSGRVVPDDVAKKTSASVPNLVIDIPGTGGTYSIPRTPHAIENFLKGFGIQPRNIEELASKLKFDSYLSDRYPLTRYFEFYEPPSQSDRSRFYRQNNIIKLGKDVRENFRAIAKQVRGY